MLKNMDFYHLLENIKKELLDTRVDTLKTGSKKVFHKTGEFLGNKIADAVTNLYDNKIVKTKPVEKIIIFPEKKRRDIKRISANIIKREHYKISKPLNDSPVSKFVIKSGSK